MDVSTIDRRRAIIDAASMLMAEAGSRATTIAAVAERVGMTDAGVLCHYKAKRDLTLAVPEQFEQARSGNSTSTASASSGSSATAEVSMADSVRAYVDHALERLAPRASVR